MAFWIGQVELFHLETAVKILKLLERVLDTNAVVASHMDGGMTELLIRVRSTRSRSARYVRFSPRGFGQAALRQRSAHPRRSLHVHHQWIDVDLRQLRNGSHHCRGVSKIMRR